AEKELMLARELMRPWVVSDATAPIITVDFYLGLLRLRHGRSAEAVLLLDDAVRGFASLEWIQRTDYTYEVRASLGEAYESAGNLDAAFRSMNRALEGSIATLGEHHPTTQLIRIGLARVALQRSGPVDAQAIASAIDTNVLMAASPEPDSLAVAELQKLKGLIAMRQNRLPDARTNLAEAARIYRARYGANHASTRAIEEQLATVTRLA